MELARDSFPQSLGDAHPDKVLVETYGWQFGTWGGLCALLACFVLASEYIEKGPGGTEWLASGVVAAAGVAMLAYEVRRRSNRTALIIDGDRVGIYRRGRLDAQVSRGEIGCYRFEPMNTVEILIALGMFGVPAGILSLVAPLSIRDRVLAIAATLAIASAIASSIRTRHYCDIYLLPRRWRGLEWFMASRSLRLNVLR